MPVCKRSSSCSRLLPRSFREPVGPLRPQNPSSVLDAREIVVASSAATDRSWTDRVHYRYLLRDEDRRLDSDGCVRSEGCPCLSNHFPQRRSVHSTRGAQRGASISQGTKETGGEAPQANARDARGAGLSTALRGGGGEQHVVDPFASRSSFPLQPPPFDGSFLPDPPGEKCDLNHWPKCYTPRWWMLRVLRRENLAARRGCGV
jgi:hypothetical protein